MHNSYYLLDKNAEKPSEEVISALTEFRENIPTLQSEMKLPFILLQDGKSQAFYVECYVEAKVAIPLIDINAALDPEEQEQFRLQRKLQPTNKAFIKMCYDAIENRQFSDIIAEYDTSYRSGMPLKLLGGQHRTVAIQEALQKKKSRYHGFKIFFNLSVNQRNEMAQIANTNIAISLDLIDRMQETVRGPHLRTFCQRTGLLGTNEDFADRKNPEGIITVRLARTFIVNFFEGKKHRTQNMQKSIFNPYICKSGLEIDERYRVIADKEPWEDAELLETARNFARLHKKQMEIIDKDEQLNRIVEFRNKVLSLAVLSSWAFAAGFLQDKKVLLTKLYSLPASSGDVDPLAARIMSESRHPKDDRTYRCLGVRSGKVDRGRITELFLEYSSSREKRITEELIESAIMTHELGVAQERANKARKRAHVYEPE
jgi:hypothetical protein